MFHLNGFKVCFGSFEFFLFIFFSFIFKSNEFVMTRSPSGSIPLNVWTPVYWKQIEFTLLVIFFTPSTRSHTHTIRSTWSQFKSWTWLTTTFFLLRIPFGSIVDEAKSVKISLPKVKKWRKNKLDSPNLSEPVVLNKTNFNPRKIGSKWHIKIQWFSVAILFGCNERWNRFHQNYIVIILDFFGFDFTELFVCLQCCVILSTNWGFCAMTINRNHQKSRERTTKTNTLDSQRLISLEIWPKSLLILPKNSVPAEIKFSFQ